MYSSGDQSDWLANLGKTQTALSATNHRQLDLIQFNDLLFHLLDNFNDLFHGNPRGGVKFDEPIKHQLAAQMAVSSG